MPDPPPISITPGKVAAYLADGGNHCPYCGSSEVEADGGVDVQGGTATQEVSCLVCEQTWQDVYRLVVIAIHDPESGRFDHMIHPESADSHSPSPVEPS